jgi:cytochrome c biogenesis protein CcmG/thiol:disulfide interchange protein DsbE
MMSKTSLWTRLIPIAVFLVVAGFFAYGLSRDPSKIPTEMIDRPLPNFELPGLRDDEGVISDDVLRGQTSLVNVFGSWCVACLQEHPTLMRLAASTGVKIVGVNWRDDRQDALTWLQRHGDPYERIIFDADSELAIELGVTGAPETFVVDPNGRIRFKQVGPITEKVFKDTITPILKAIEAESDE